MGIGIGLNLFRIFRVATGQAVANGGAEGDGYGEERSRLYAQVAKAHQGSNTRHAQAKARQRTPRYRLTAP